MVYPNLLSSANADTDISDASLCFCEIKVLFDRRSAISVRKGKRIRRPYVGWSGLLSLLFNVYTNGQGIIGLKCFFNLLF